MGKVINHPVTSNNRNASIEQPIVENFDLSTITGSQKVFTFNAHLITKKTLLFQIDYTGLNALDATAVLQHSNNGKPGSFKDIIGLSPVTLDTASGTSYLEGIDFSGGYIQLLLILNSLTIGTLGIHAIAKD